jgi:hypothetical protein
MDDTNVPLVEQGMVAKMAPKEDSKITGIFSWLSDFCAPTFNVAHIRGMPFQSIYIEMEPYYWKLRKAEMDVAGNITHLRDSVFYHIAGHTNTIMGPYNKKMKWYTDNAASIRNATHDYMDILSGVQKEDKRSLQRWEELKSRLHRGLGVWQKRYNPEDRAAREINQAFTMPLTGYFPMDAETDINNSE